MENNFTLILIVVGVVFACNVLFGMVFQEESLSTAVCGTIGVMVVTAVFVLTDQDKKNDAE